MAEKRPGRPTQRSQTFDPAAQREKRAAESAKAAKKSAKLKRKAERERLGLPISRRHTSKEERGGLSRAAKRKMPPARPRSEKRPKRPPPTGPEMDAVAREIMAADPARRLEAVKRGERRLALIQSSRAGVPAAAHLARITRNARLQGCGDAGEEGLTSAAKQAWQAQRVLLQPALHAVKSDPRAPKAALREVVDEGQRAFAAVLHEALQHDRIGQAHALLMALGDLERYRETLIDGGETARTLYLRALRLRPATGRCAGNIGALCASTRPWEAAHWYLRAGCAREPYGDAPKALRLAAAAAQRGLAAMRPAHTRDAEAHLSAAACAVVAGPSGKVENALDEVKRAGKEATRVLRATFSGEGPHASDLARVVTTACVLARRAAVACDAPTVAAAHLVCDQICEAALEGAMVSDATKRRAAPAALVAMTWLASTMYRAPRGRAGARLAAFAHACASDASSTPCALDDDLVTAGVFDDAPCRSTADVQTIETDATKGHAERCRRLVQLASTLEVAPAPAPAPVRPPADLAGVLGALGVEVPPPKAAPRRVAASSYELAPRDRLDRSESGDAADLLQAAASAHLAVPAPKKALWAAPPEVPSPTEERRPWTRPQSPVQPTADPAAAARARALAIVQAHVPALAPPGLAPDVRRPWSRPAQRPASPAPSAPPPPPVPVASPPGMRRPSPPPPALPTPTPGAAFLFVVDASNVALRHGRKQTFSCRGIKICLAYIGERFPGARVALFLPDYVLDAARVAAKRKSGGRPAETPDNVAYLQGLVESNVLFPTPPQDYDDSYQIEYARTHGGIIVSNDMFRDAVQKEPFMKRAALRTWLQQHVLSFTFIGDEFAPNPDFQLPSYQAGPVSILQ